MTILNLTIETTALIVAGTMVGNELAVGVFVHPCLSQLDGRSHTHSIQALSRIFGRVMPAWYAATLVLSVAVVLMMGKPLSVSWWLACVSAVLFAICIGYTIFGLVPINNRVSEWNLNELPSNWREQRQLWDRRHRVRIVLLVAALILLTVSILLEQAA